MNSNSTKLITRHFILLFLFVTSQSLYSQTHTAVPTTMGSYVGGFYEYLPMDYDPSQSKEYPLIIFLHGSGEQGNGKLPALQMLEYTGLPRLIERDEFPRTFMVDGAPIGFIVISPQFSRWPLPQDIQEVLDFILPRYKVNRSRIYITGLSMGGGATWDYAKSSIAAAGAIAAIVPIAADSDPTQGSPGIIATANLPVWATHNDGDAVVAVSKTNGYVAAINSTMPAPNPLARKTIFNSNSHDAWSTTYDPGFRENGLNIYEWMLQFSRTSAALPIVLSQYNVSMLSASAVAINWTTTFEQNNNGFIIEHSVDGQSFKQIGHVKASNIATGDTYKHVHANPAGGSNFYRIKQVDVSGNVTIYKILQIGLAATLSNILQVYPNPVVNQLNIGIDNSYRGYLQVNIFDYSGKIVDTRHFTKPADYWIQPLHTGRLAPGHYILELKGNNFQTSRNFIKK